MKHRRIEPEVMDDPSLDPARHRRALRGLHRLNRIGGSARLVWKALHGPAFAPARRANRPLRVLDLATGGGDLPIALHRRAQRRANHGKAAIRIDGCDLSGVALQHARDQARRAGPWPETSRDRQGAGGLGASGPLPHGRGSFGNRPQTRPGAEIHFFPLDALRDPLPGGYDVLLTSLFLHHLDDAQAVRLLRRMADAARLGIIVNDLRRSRANLAMVHLASRLLSRSGVVRTDATRSVRAALTIPEARSLARRAGLEEANIAPAFPCRYLLTWSHP